MNGTRHREVGEYLRRLQRSMGDLPAERRDEILAEIEEHIAELLAENPAATDAEVRNVLERVGDPEDIAAEARDRLGINPVARSRRPRSSWTDTAAVALLVVGTLMITPLYRPEVMVTVWIAATVLIWMSEVWSTRDKVLVTLVLPAGALSAVAIQGSGDEGFLYFSIILFAAIWPPTHLGLKLRQAHAASDEGIAVGAQKHPGVEPAESEGRDRTTGWLIGGVLALVLLGSILYTLFSTSGGEESHLAGDTPRVTQAQFDEVDLGDKKDDVFSTLGGEGDGGSIVSGLDPEARETPEEVGEQQFDDCWSYSLTGVGAGSDAAVCFDSSDEVVYTRVRIA